MGVLEIYFAIGIVVAIFVLVGVFSEDFDEVLAEVGDGYQMTIWAKVFVTLLTVAIWPYTVIRFFVLWREKE